MTIQTPEAAQAPEWLVDPIPVQIVEPIPFADQHVAEGFDGTALWLGRENPDPPVRYGQHANAPALRRRFEIPGAVTNARLSIASYGYYEATINGVRVGDAVLDPPMSQFDRTVYSRSYDVTDLVNDGANAIGVVLGRGYVSGISGPGARWTSEPRALVQIDIDLADGERVTIVSDGEWCTADSPTRDWMYYGETYDARQEQQGWTLPEFDDTGWAPAISVPWPTERTVPAKASPVTVMRTFAPVSERTVEPGVSVFDAGQMTAGWALLEVSGKRGTRLRVSYGQQTDQVTGRAALFAPGMHIDEYVLRGGGVEQWEPRFTRHSFQFFDVEVVEGPALTSLTAQVREVYTSVESTGSFSTSNGLLNTIHENQRRSLLLNHWGLPTDTGGRDRQGWTADTACFLDSAVLNFAGLVDLYRDWLGALRDAQQGDGTLSVFAPDPYQAPVFNDPSWSGMIVMIPWSLYQYTGDESLLRESFDTMLSWMDLMESFTTATGDLYEGFGFGDHSSPGTEEGGTVNLSPREGSDVVRNAHLYLEARTLATIARLLTGSADAGARWDAMADRILPAFTAKYFKPETGEYWNPGQKDFRQANNVVALAFGLVAEENQTQVVERLVRDLESRGDRLNTGAIGTKYLLPTLTRFGYGDLAYRIAAQTTYPSWGYWVSKGATSSWETWDNEGTEQTLDHPFLGTVDDWFFQGLLGIKPLTPGYASTVIAPLFPVDLDRASATIKTPHGTVGCEWVRTPDGITLDVTAPETVSVRLELAEQATELTSGFALDSSEGAGRVAWTGTGSFTVDLAQAI